MRLGIMQPYFFPYIGYFQLIAATDEWIVFDTPQYIRHGWVNRNRVLKYDGNDWLYLNVPLQKHGRDTAINEIQVAGTEDWRAKMCAQLLPYKKKAPFFRETMEVFNEAVGIATDNLSGLNVHALEAVCSYVGIDFRYRVYSQMELEHPGAQHAGEWALHISRAVGAKTYINPPGGRDIFDKEQFREAGIELQFLQPELRPYSQKNATFVPGLSIIDVMMFNAAGDIRQMLGNYKLSD